MKKLFGDDCTWDDVLGGLCLMAGLPIFWILTYALFG